MQQNLLRNKAIFYKTNVFLINWKCSTMFRVLFLSYKWKYFINTFVTFIQKHNNMYHLHCTTKIWNINVLWSIKMPTKKQEFVFWMENILIYCTEMGNWEFSSSMEQNLRYKITTKLSFIIALFHDMFANK